MEKKLLYYAKKTSKAGSVAGTAPDMEKPWWNAGSETEQSKGFLQKIQLPCCRSFPPHAGWDGKIFMRWRDSLEKKKVTNFLQRNFLRSWKNFFSKMVTLPILILQIIDNINKALSKSFHFSLFTFIPLGHPLFAFFFHFFFTHLENILTGGT